MVWCEPDDHPFFQSIHNYSAARNSVPQASATTFAFFLFILLLYRRNHLVVVPRFRATPEAASSSSCLSGSSLPPSEPLSLYKPRNAVKQEPGHLGPAASAYSNYPAYGGLPHQPTAGLRPPPPPVGGNDGSAAAAVSPTYPRVSSTTHSDNEREGDIGKRRRSIK